MALALALSLAAVREPLGGSLPPPGYTTGGVVLDGATWLLNMALALGVDSGVFSASLWLWFPAAPGSSQALWESDSAAQGNNYAELDVDGSCDTEIANESNDALIDLTTNAPTPLGVWQNQIWSLDINANPTVGKVYIDGVDASGSGAGGAGGGAFTMDGLPFSIGSSTTGGRLLTAYTADLWIAPNQSLLVDGDIPPETIAKFIKDGKPVDLGSDGSTPTGTSPAIFLHIDADGDPADFATNRGTGGDFAVGGGVTQTGALVSGSADVVMADVTGITAGAFVHVTGVPAGTTVLSIDTLTVTMSAQATATNPTASIKFGGALMLAPSSPSD
jgi:hypothetical protein